MVCNERCRQWCPHVAGRAETMQQHDRRALTSDSSVDRSTICLNLAGFEGSGEKYQIVSQVDKFHFCAPVLKCVQTDQQSLPLQIDWSINVDTWQLAEMQI
jgi:hypothetical protein